MFLLIMIQESQVESVINHRVVSGVTLTGSGRAGRAVASLAGKALKKCVLELGGSDAFIVCKDADIDKAAMIAVRSRMQNSGQTCIAAKRIIVDELIKNEFIERVLFHCKKYKAGDPYDPETTIGYIARPDLMDQLVEQVNTSISMGARVLLGGGRVGESLHFNPMVLDCITADMPLYNEEVFGPVMPILSFHQFDEAIKIANSTSFGLGATLFCHDEATILQFKNEIEAGAIAINALLSSTPDLPFGGIKESGFGRELGKEGLLEFVNVKSVIN